MQLLLNTPSFAAEPDTTQLNADLRPHMARFLREAAEAGEIDKAIDPAERVAILSDMLLGRIMRLPPDDDAGLLAALQPSWEAALASAGISDPAILIGSVPTLELPARPVLPPRNRRVRESIAATVRTVPREASSVVT